MNEIIKHYQELTIKYDKKVMKLEYKIDEAIEYINSTGYGTDFSMSAEEVDKLLKILSGDEYESINRNNIGNNDRNIIR